MKYLLLGLLVISLLTVGFTDKYTDQHARARVVFLSSAKGYCTGVEVRSPKGVLYTLTARHCKDLAINNRLSATQENEKSTTIRVVAIDAKSDLMLLEGVGQDSLVIANSYEKHGKVHSMTHGGGFPSYRTDGELLVIKDLFMTTPALSAQDVETCMKEGGEMGIDLFLPVCTITLHQMLTTVSVIPGSSGGPIMNEQNQLVGIVSLRLPDNFSAMVTLDDIHAFLKDR